MLSILLLTSSFIVFSSAVDPYKCAQYLINPPDDLNEPYYWPSSWNESMQPATYAGSQNCNWQISVLEGTYATVTFYKDTESESGITCQYPNGEVSYIEDKELNPYIFTNPQFQVNLRVSDKQGMFSFKVVWSKFPGRCQMDAILGDERPMAQLPSECVTTYTAPNNVFFVGFTLADDLYVLLRQSLIFDGDSVNSPYVGNLYSARYKNIISTGKKLTVFNFPAVYRNFNYTLYMGMDTKAAGDVKSFTGVNCPSDTTKQCFVTVNAMVNVSAVATISPQADYIQPFLDFPQGATLKVYEGQMSDDRLLTSLNRSNYLNQLPLGVKQFIKIYHLDTGRISFPITRNGSVANYGTVSDGRSVKIQSFFYGTTSYDQNTNEVFSTSNNEKLYFNFAVKDCNFNSQTTLAISITKDGQPVFSQTYNTTNLPPTNVQKALGDRMTVDYQTNGNYTTGFEIDLVTTKSDEVFSSPSTLSSTSTKSLTSTVSTSSSPIATSSSSATSNARPSTKSITASPTASTTSLPSVSSTIITTTSSRTQTDSPTTGGPIPSSGSTTLAPTPKSGVSTTVRTPTAMTSQNPQTTTKSSFHQFSFSVFCVSVLYFL